jgi:uncharacterized protein (DUF2141 family)
LCYGNSTGAITVTASGGTGTKTYNLYNASNVQEGSSYITGEFTQRAAGTYKVTVEDANGCMDERLSIAITQPAAALSMGEPAVTNVLCYGNSTGAITVTASGGTGTKTYKLYNVSNTQVGSSNTTGQFAQLAAGTYKVTVEDANGCSAERTSVVVSQPASALSIGVASIHHVTCYDGSNGQIDITASGGAGTKTYKLYNAGNEMIAENTSGHFEQLIAGTYEVVAVDENGCEVSRPSITVNQPTAIIVQPAPESVRCYGESNGRITVNAEKGSGLYEYSLKSGSGQYGAFTASNVFESLAVGVYQVKVKDNANCEVESGSITVGQPAQIQANLASENATTASAKDGTIKVDARGGVGPYQFGINANPMITSGVASHTFTGLDAGTYAVHVKDAKGCETPSSAEYTVAISIVLGIGDMTAGEFKLYPNPTDGRFFLQWDSLEDQTVTVEIYGTSGKLVYKNQVRTGVGSGVQTRIDISSQPKGTYVLRIPELNINRKIIIQ